MRRLNSNYQTMHYKRGTRKLIAFFIIALFVAEVIIGLPALDACAEENSPNEITEGLWVQNPNRSTYLFYQCNNTYLQVQLKEGTQGTDFLQLWFDGIPLVATYGGINTWAFELQDSVHNLTFSPGAEVYVDSVWVQQVLLASNNITMQLDEWKAASFKAGGDCMLLLQANFSYLDIGVKINGIPLKEKHSYLMGGTNPYPDADCATVAGGIEGSTWNKFSFSLDAPGIQNLSLTGEGWIHYAIVGAGLDFDADKINDDVEVEHFGELGYHPTLASAWGYNLYTEAHPTYWDDLGKFYESAINGQINPEQSTTQLVEAFAFYVPPSWSTSQLNLYVDVVSGLAENFSLDNEPVLFNERIFGFDFLGVNGTTVQGVDQWDNLVTVSTDDCYKVGEAYLSNISTGWHIVDWWIDAEVNYYIGTKVNFCINEYTIPIIADPPAQDDDLDGLVDDWETATGANAERYDSDFDGLIDEADLSVDASLWCPKGSLAEFIYPVRTPQDNKVEVQVKSLAMNENLTMPLAWQPDKSGPQTQVVCTPAIRIMGPGNRSVDGEADIDVYWQDKASLSTFWEKSIQSYLLAPTPSNVVSGNCDPLPSVNNPNGAYFYYDFILPTSQTDASWEFQFSYSKTHPALGDRFLDVVFDVVFVLVNASWESSSQASILRWYEPDQPILIQGLRISEISNVASALGSPDSACENQIIYATIQNPALGNPTTYGLSGATGSDVDVLHWEQGQSFYPAFGFNASNPPTFGVAQRLAAARKNRPRQDNESEVTYYGMDETTYDALGLINMSAQIDASGDPYGLYLANNVVGNATPGTILDSQGTAISGWIDCSTEGASVTVVEQAKNHRNALCLRPSAGQTAGCRILPSSPLNKGEVSFWVMPAANTSELEVQITGMNGGRIGPRLHLQQGRLWAEYPGATGHHHDICAIWPNEMFLVQVFFDATNTDGYGYGNFTLAVTGAGAGLHEGKFWLPYCLGFDAIDGITFLARTCDVYIDAVNFFTTNTTNNTVQEDPTELLHARVAKYRKSFYIISDFYDGFFSASDPELQGQDDIVWQSSYINALHERKQIYYYNWPIEIDFIKSSSLSNFQIADVLRLTSTYGNINADNPVPRNKADFQSDIYNPLIFLNEYFVEPTNEVLRFNLTVLPPPLNFGVVDDLKSAIDLRESVRTCIDALFERGSYSAWEWFLWRLQYLKWLTGRQVELANRVAEILEQYCQGWVHSFDIKYRRKGLAILKKDQSMFESWTDADWKAHQIPSDLRDIILKEYKTMGEERVKYICKGMTFKQSISAKTLASWVQLFVKRMEIALPEISKEIGAPTYEYYEKDILDSLGNIVKKEFEKRETFVTFTGKAYQLLALLEGKAIRIYGMGFYSNFNEKVEKDYLLWGFEGGRQWRLNDVPRTWWLFYPWEGAARLLFTPKKVGAENLVGPGILIGFPGKWDKKLIGRGVDELTSWALKNIEPAIAEELNNLWQMNQEFTGPGIFGEISGLDKVIRYGCEIPNFDYVKRIDQYHPHDLVDRTFQYRKTYLAIQLGKELFNQVACYFGANLAAYQNPPPFETMVQFIEALYELPGAPEIVIQKFLEHIVGTPLELQLFDTRVQSNLHAIFEEIKTHNLGLIPFASDQYGTLLDNLESTMIQVYAALTDVTNPQGTRFRALQDAAIHQTRAENRYFMRVEQAVRKYLKKQGKNPAMAEWFSPTYYTGRSPYNSNVKTYWNPHKGSFGVPDYIFHSTYGIMSYAQARAKYGYDISFYDGYFPNESPDFDPLFMAWLQSTRSRGHLPTQNIAHDLASQWITVITQADISKEAAIATQLQHLATNLAGMGLIAGVIALASACVGGIAPQIGEAIATQGAQAAGVSVGVMVGIQIPIYSWFSLDWSTPEACTESLLLILKDIEGFALLVGLLVAGLKGVSLVGGITTIICLIAAGALYTWSLSYNQMLDVLSQIRLIQSADVVIPDAVRRNIVRHGAFQAGDQITFSLTATNTGHKTCYISSYDGFYSTSWSGDGGDFTYHTRFRISPTSTLPTGWTAEQSSVVPAAFTIIKNGITTRDTPGGSVTHSETLTLPASNDLNLYYKTYFTPEQGDPTNQEICCIPLSEYGIYVTEPTLAGFLAHAHPTELSQVRNKTGDFIMAILQGRFKDASNLTDQAIGVVGFTPEQFNITFGKVTLNHCGIAYCLGCGVLADIIRGHCSRCGWTHEYYGLKVSRYEGVCGWQDLVTRYFGEGFRPAYAAMSWSALSLPVEEQVSFHIYQESDQMLLVPKEWIARKNQSMLLLQTLIDVRGNFSLRSNLDILPLWSEMLAIPPNGTVQGSLQITIDGPDNPLVRVELGTPLELIGTLITGQGLFPIKTFPAINFEIRPASNIVRTGYYIMPLNLTFANGTPIVECFWKVYNNPVYDIRIEGISPQNVAVSGGNAMYDIRVTNYGNVPQTVTLFCGGAPVKAWIFTKSMQDLSPGQSLFTTLTITTAPLSPGSYSFTIGVLSPASISFTQEFYLIDSIDLAPVNGEWWVLVGIFMMVAFVGGLLLFLLMRAPSVLRLGLRHRSPKPSLVLESHTQNISSRFRGWVVRREEKISLDALEKRVTRLCS